MKSVTLTYNEEDHSNFETFVRSILGQYTSMELTLGNLDQGGSMVHSAVFTSEEDCYLYCVIDIVLSLFETLDTTNGIDIFELGVYSSSNEMFQYYANQRANIETGRAVTVATSHFNLQKTVDEVEEGLLSIGAYYERSGLYAFRTILNTIARELNDHGIDIAEAVNESIKNTVH